jgi:hypothetical protein
MSWHEFIFSDKKKHRYTRHIVFWVLWWLYFYGSRYFYPKPLLSGPTGILKLADSVRKISGQINSNAETANVWGTTEFIRSLLMLSIHIAACYIIIYFLLRYLLKARYLLFLSGLMLLIFAMILASRFVDMMAIAFIAGKTDIVKTPYYASIFVGVINAIKIIAVAMAIKLGKHWWFKQKEKEKIEKEKIDAELQLLKAQIHPRFLFDTLNNIYSYALTASLKAPEMLLKLSDILSYMLYECNDAEVSLEKEIKMLRGYMALEKTRYGDKLEMNILVKSDGKEYRIAPLLLLRFIENSFRQSSNNKIEQAWINLEMHIENHVLEMKLMNGKTAESPLQENGEENDLSLAERRLQLLYHGKHILKVTEEPEIMIVTLRLDLTGSTAKNETLQNRVSESGSLLTVTSFP